MSDPTDAGMREAFARAHADTEHHAAMFDRWLAEHDREVERKAREDQRNIDAQIAESGQFDYDGVNRLSTDEATYNTARREAAIAIRESAGVECTCPSQSILSDGPAIDCPVHGIRSSGSGS